MSSRSQARVTSGRPLTSGLGTRNVGCRSSARARAKAGTPTAGVVLIPDLRNVLPLANKAMFLQIGGKVYQIASFAQASQMFCIARDRHGEGASNTPSPLIVDDAGSIIAHDPTTVEYGRAIRGPWTRYRSMTIGSRNAKSRSNDRCIAHQVSGPRRSVCRSSNPQRRRNLSNGIRPPAKYLRAPRCDGSLTARR